LYFYLFNLLSALFSINCRFRIRDKREKRIVVSLCFDFFYYIGNCAQNVRIFACKIKVHLFIPQEWGNEGVEVLKHFFIFK
jgi:hypothetical protein